MKKELSEETIRSDNPFFGPVIRLIEEGPYKSASFPELTFFRTVGAHNSKFDLSLAQDGSEIQVVDAWATYLWDSRNEKWVLGAN